MCVAGLQQQQQQHGAFWKFFHSASLTAALPPASLLAGDVLPSAMVAKKLDRLTHRYNPPCPHQKPRSAVNVWRCVGEHPAVLTHGFMGEEAFEDTLFGKVAPKLLQLASKKR